MAPLVEIRNLSQRFGGFAALDHVSLDIPEGAYVVLLGPSGSGKTTLLNVLGGFLEPTSGEVLIASENVTHVPPALRPTATVFQDYALFPHMSVGHNVGFGLRMRGVDSKTREARALEMLKLVGLEHVFDRKPHELSGGQRQRVALARALIIEPRLLLLDEPLGALDLKLRRQMQDELKSLRQRVGTTFVHVTHDQEEAMALADVIVVMNGGKIEDLGEPTRVYAKPASRFTATFMGESNLLDGTVKVRARGVTCVATAFGELSCVDEAPAGSAVTLAIRPEKLRVSGTGQKIADAVVTDISFQGAFVRVAAQAENGQVFHLRVEPGAAIAPGQKIKLVAGSQDMVLLTR